MTSMMLLTCFIFFANSADNKTVKNDLPVQYEELTTPQFVKALEKSGGTCVIPIGILEKHGPHLAHAELGSQQSGADLARLDRLEHAYTGIWWYANYPNHYAGDGSKASAEIGNLIINSEAKQLASLVKALKTDNRILELQQQFFKQSQNPLKTKQ